MKFCYEYRTCDNVRHEAVINAVSREAAFGELRRLGIRPARLNEAPGFLNKILGKGKRWLAICFLCLLCLVLGVSVLHNSKTSESDGTVGGHGQVRTSSPRHQIYGDPVVTRKLTLGSELAKVITNRGDLVLASFAQPGARVRLADYSDTQQWQALNDAVLGDLEIHEDDLGEIVELKRIINGMKAEMRDYLAHEGCSLQMYYRELLGRSRREAHIVERVRRELRDEKDISVWESKNSQLRKIGLRPIDMPEELFE